MNGLYQVTDYLRGHPTFRFQITLDDEFAHADDQVETLLDDLARTPGVTRVQHEDREVILVAAGPGLTAEALQVRLSDWFAGQEGVWPDDEE